MTPKAHRKRWVTDAIANFPGADTDGLQHFRDEDFTVTNLAGAGTFFDGLNGLVDDVIADYRLDFDLGEKIHHVFRAAVEFGMTFLAPETFDFGDREALDPDCRQCLTDIIELEGFNYGSNQFHDDTSCAGLEHRGGNDPWG